MQKLIRISKSIDSASVMEAYISPADIIMIEHEVKQETPANRGPVPANRTPHIPGYNRYKITLTSGASVNVSVQEFGRLKPLLGITE